MSVTKSLTMSSVPWSPVTCSQTGPPGLAAGVSGVPSIVTPAGFAGLR